MKIGRQALKFYGRFAAAYGTAWLVMFLAVVVTQSNINAGAYGFYGFPVIALFYATVRAFTDAKLGKDTGEAKPRFSLRGLFVVIAFAALLLAWWTDHWRLAEGELVGTFLLPELRARMEAEEASLQAIADLLDAPIGYERAEGFSSPSFGEMYYVTSLEVPQVTITDRQIAPLAALLGAFPHLSTVLVGQKPLMSPAQLARLRAALPNIRFGDVMWVGGVGPDRMKQFPNKVYPQDRNPRAAP